MAWKYLVASLGNVFWDFNKLFITYKVEINILTSPSNCHNHQTCFLKPLKCSPGLQQMFCLLHVEFPRNDFQTLTLFNANQQAEKGWGFSTFPLGFWDVLRHPNPQHPKGIQISAVGVTWGPWGSRRVPFEIAAVPAPKVLLQYAKTKRSLGKARVILYRICSNSLLGEGKWFIPGFLYRSTISSELSELATCSCASTFEVDGG